MNAVLFWLFGVSAIGAICNLPAWARMLAEQWSTGQSRRLSDAYLIMRGGMVLGTLGIGGGSIAWMMAIAGVAVPAWAPVFWVVPLALAETAFLWVAALRSQGEVPPRKNPSWVAYIAIATVWTMFVLLWGLAR